MKVRVSGLSLGQRFRTLLSRRVGAYVGPCKHTGFPGVWVIWDDTLKDQTVHANLLVELLPDQQPVSRGVHWPEFHMRDYTQVDISGGTEW